MQKAQLDTLLQIKNHVQCDINQILVNGGIW